MHIRGLAASGKEPTQVLSCMPKLSELLISHCERITGLGVVEQRQKATASSNEVETQIGWLQNSIEEEEIAAEGLLLLPPQLHELLIEGCPNLILLPDSLVDDKEARLTQRAGCLQGLCSLLSLKIWGCPKFLSYLSPSSSCFPFPTSLQKLSLGLVEGMETLVPFSNLTTLTELEITDCGDLRNDGLWHLLTQDCLTKLSISKTPTFFVGSEPSQLHEEGLNFCPPKLQMLWTDDVAGALAAPICSLLSSSLTSLFVFENEEIVFFTKEREEALQLLTSLQEFRFYHCSKLQFLPAGLHRLPNLKRLKIHSSPDIRTLPKEVLPCCPAIRTLPKVGLPYSLRVLNVHNGNSEELRRQCRKLIGVIPIVEA
ncbi:hypothetical protein BAE44_0022747 [Dichanthelium oligosanthes]|uniref:Uncharacterized protein n=1 Tax=Dichanthelium oligosanthes TaxID=888268 RepID=A0A1E5UTN2_9POAL|nr:hypothetical protein BAE44_0022747 [Dichanthelium oligosanthes]